MSWFYLFFFLFLVDGLANLGIPRERIWEVMMVWNSNEWINYGTLIGGLTLRVLFLMGVGRS